MRTSAEWCKLAVRPTAVSLVAWLTASLFSAPQAQDALASSTPEQLAAAIAQTMRATNPSSPGGPLLQEITSKGAVVESRMTIRDATAFKKVEMQESARRLTLTRFICRPERLPYLKRGVVFRYITVGPGPSNIDEFTINEQSCASLAKFVDADPATLIKSAETLAQRLKTRLSQGRARSGIVFESAVAHDGTVQIIEVVTDPDLVERFSRAGLEMQGISQGFFCAESQAAIHRGVKLNVLYERADGKSLLDVPIDSSVC